MKSRSVVFAAAGLLLAATPAMATITPVVGGSSTWAVFGSQGTTYMDSDPITYSPFTPAAPLGPYTPGLGLPNVPQPPASMQYPGVPGGNPFNGGAGYNYLFIDPLAGTTQYTAAQTTIVDVWNPAGTLVSDVSIDFPIWRFAQGPVAPSYAYEQVNFVTQYQVTNALAAAAPALPLFLTGSVSGLGTPFVQFDAEINYWWVDTNTAFTPTGTPVLLGTLTYSWQQIGAGPFFQIVSSSGSLAAAPSALGVLELSGYAYVTGDPFEIQIANTPEPATLSVLAVGGAALLLRRRRAPA